MLGRPDRKPGVKRPIVFLHIPKTAGQTIHHTVGSIVGEAQISPIRVHSQVKSGETQFPTGFSFYSGHLDWVDLKQLPDDRFVFTILRDPRERIASFYFFLQQEAQGLTPDELYLPENQGKFWIRNNSADNYFFSDDRTLSHFVHDHYDNFYCAYLATKRIRGYAQMRELSTRQKVKHALANRGCLNRIYHITQLEALEQEFRTRFGVTVNIANKFLNKGKLPMGEKRWPVLLEQFESDTHKSRIESFVDADLELMARLGLPLDSG